MKIRTLAIASALMLTACSTVSGNDVTSFEECVAAGNPVMESYPRQCRAGDKHFVENVDALPEPPAQ
jgi:hypothetical protein